MAALQLPGGALIKINPRATPAHFLQAASACNAQQAAAELVGQVVAAGGLAKAPLILLASYAEVTTLHFANDDGAELEIMCKWPFPLYPPAYPTHRIPPCTFPLPPSVHPTPPHPTPPHPTPHDHPGACSYKVVIGDHGSAV